MHYRLHGTVFSCKVWKISDINLHLRSFLASNFLFDPRSTLDISSMQSWQQEVYGFWPERPPREPYHQMHYRLHGTVFSCKVWKISDINLHLRSFLASNFLFDPRSTLDISSMQSWQQEVYGFWPWMAPREPYHQMQQEVSLSSLASLSFVLSITYQMVCSLIQGDATFSHH